jgi:hypothetical protein
MTAVALSAPPTLRAHGDAVELAAIVRWFNPDADATFVAVPRGRSVGAGVNAAAALSCDRVGAAVTIEMLLRADIDSIAISLLAELHHAADTRGAREEGERYTRIADSARALRLALGDVAVPGVLLGPLSQLESKARAGQSTESRRPSNIGIARSICVTWDEGWHPLEYIERAAKKAAADLAAKTSKRGKGTLHARLHGDPQAVFSLACARLFVDSRKTFPPISKSGDLVKLAHRIWYYARGEAAPASLAAHVQKAARLVRATGERNPIPGC